MTTSIYYLAAFGVVAIAAIALWFAVVVVDVTVSALRDWRRARSWRPNRRRSPPTMLKPLSLDLRPRLGDLVWVAHDAVDATKGGVPCEVLLVDRAGVVHRDVPPVRVSRMT